MRLPLTSNRAVPVPPLSTGLLTNWVKVQVGRPRPHFVNRCWPQGLKPVFSPDGVPLCADSAIDPAEGIKSFPSGHTSWSTSGEGRPCWPGGLCLAASSAPLGGAASRGAALQRLVARARCSAECRCPPLRSPPLPAGLGFATFWLLGKLRCFDGQAQPLRFVAALLPLLGAVWIGLSRISDYWHHVEDVLAGFCLGLLMAFCFYRQVYCGVMGPHAGQLTASRAAGGLRSVPSRYQLLYNGSGESLEEQQGQGLPLLQQPYGVDDKV